MADRTGCDLVGFGLESPTEEWIELLREAEAAPPLGTIGPFELLDEVGRGGQGVVYRALQPGTGRVIALKRMLAGAWASESMRGRFEREVRAAAALCHPAIVTVYGMEQVEGQPLLAMEWVDGQPVSDWARGRPPRAIVELFARIADGVAHAHARGVVHRDLKPSNILIDARGEPHVLDFGLAKLADDPHASASRSTFVGTPAYAAPEQVRSAPCDPRTDVHALGAVLYEALTGTLPFDATGTLAATLHSIEHDEPRAPSTRARGLDRDLDAILLLALAKEPERRYRGADALADDLRLWLAGKPVQAHAPSARYLFGKLVRRHRLAFGLGATAFGLVASIAVIAVLQASRLRHERDVARAAEKRANAAEASAHSARAAAEMEATRSKAVRGFLLEDMIHGLSPAQLPGELTVRKILEAARGTVAARFAGQPRLEVEVRHAIGSVLAKIGAYGAAIAEQECALALLDGWLSKRPSDDPERASVEVTRTHILRDLGAAHSSASDYDQAETVLRSAIADCGQRRDEDRHTTRVECLLHLGHLLAERGRFDEARASFAACATTLDAEKVASADLLRAELYTDLAGLATHVHDYAEAERHYAAAEALYERIPGQAMQLAMVGCGHGQIMMSLGRLDDAEALLRGATSVLLEYQGPDHPNVLTARSVLADVEIGRGNYGAAALILEDVVECQTRCLERPHQLRVATANKLANCYSKLGRTDAALGRFEAALAEAIELFGARNVTVASLRANLAGELLRSGRTQDAKRNLQESLEITGEVHGQDSLNYLRGLSQMGTIAASEQDYVNAEALTRRAVAGLAATLGASHKSTLQARQNLAEILMFQNCFAEARTELLAVLEARERELGAEHPAVGETLQALAGTEFKAGALASAEQLVDRALAIHRRTAAEGHLGNPRFLRALILLAQGRSAEGEQEVLAAHRAVAELLGPAHPSTRVAVKRVQDFYVRAGQPERGQAFDK